jgi:hypothetical protein
LEDRQKIFDYEENKDISLSCAAWLDDTRRIQDQEAVRRRVWKRYLKEGILLLLNAPQGRRGGTVRKTLNLIFKAF